MGYVDRKSEEFQKMPENFLDLNISSYGYDVLNLSPWERNVLLDGGFKTLREFLNLTPEEINQLWIRRDIYGARHGMPLDVGLFIEEYFKKVGLSLKQ